MTSGDTGMTTRKRERQQHREREVAAAECACSPPVKVCLAHYDLLSLVAQEEARRRAGVRVWTSR